MIEEKSKKGSHRPKIYLPNEEKQENVKKNPINKTKEKMIEV